jgi:hypothetical protein
MSEETKQTPRDLPFDITQNFFFGRCLDANDPLMLGRIRAVSTTDNYEQRIQSAVGFDQFGTFEKNGPWSDKDPFIFLSYLPYFINQVPQENEMVMLFYFDARNRSGRNKFYMIAPYSSPTTINFEDFQSARTRLDFGRQNSSVSFPPIKNGNGEFKNPTQNKGVFVEPSDISLNGRDSADIIIKNNELILRAGKHLPFKRGQIPVANDNRAFIQLTNYDKQTVNGATKEYRRLTKENLKIKYLIEYYCLNPETQFDVFTGGVLIYEVPDNQFSSEMQVGFFGYGTNYTGETNLIYQKQINSVSGVTEFAKEINDILINFKDTPNLITSTPNGQQFPFFYRPDINFRKTLTELTGNIDLIKLGNLTRIQDAVRLSTTQEIAGYGTVLNKRLDPNIPLEAVDEKVTEKITEKIDNSVGIVGANQLFFLSHKTNIEGKPPGVDLKNTIYGVGYDSVVDNLEPSTSPMVRGDELMDLLQLIVEFLLTHDHPYPMLPPTPVALSSNISTQQVLTKLQEAYDKVLNKNIRIN